MKNDGCSRVCRRQRRRWQRCLSSLSLCPRVSGSENALAAAAGAAHVGEASRRVSKEGSWNACALARHPRTDGSDRVFSQHLIVPPAPRCVRAGYGEGGGRNGNQKSRPGSRKQPDEAFSHFTLFSSQPNAGLPSPTCLVRPMQGESRCDEIGLEVT